eukprot:tig00021319_g20257.t1
MADANRRGSVAGDYASNRRGSVGGDPASASPVPQKYNRQGSAGNDTAPALSGSPAPSGANRRGSFGGEIPSDGTLFFTLLSAFGCACDSTVPEDEAEEDFSVKGKPLTVSYTDAVEQGKLVLWKCHNAEVQTFYALQRDVQATKSRQKMEEMIRFVHALYKKYPRKSKAPHRKVTLAPRAPSISRADPELLSEFLKEAEDGKALVNKMSMDEKLVSYGLYKQGCDGDNILPSPGVFEVAARMKWSAWHKWKGMEEDAAMRKLIQFTRQMKKKYGWK